MLAMGGKRTSASEIIHWNVDDVFRAKYNSESLVPVSHLGMGCGCPPVRGLPAHRPLAPLASSEIKTLSFFSH